MKDKNQRNSLWLIFYYLVFSAGFIFFLPTSVYYNPFSSREEVSQVSNKQVFELSGTMHQVDAFQNKVFSSRPLRNPKGVQEKRCIVFQPSFLTSTDRIPVLADQSARFIWHDRIISFFGHGHRLVIFIGSLRV